MPTHEARLRAVARRTLPPPIAERWTSLIRPAVRLRSARRGDRVVGRLGGCPAVPHDFEWPVWPGEGSLSFVASVDCAKLPRESIDLALPADGTLLFFYFDDTLGYFDPAFPPRPVGGRDPESLTAGARVVHVPAGVSTAEREPPADIEPYDWIPLAAAHRLTGPDWSHPSFRAACRDLPAHVLSFFDDHANGDTFMTALAATVPSPAHQIGGYAFPIQDAVELDVAAAHLRADVVRDEQAWPTVQEEARRWVALAQIDSDDETGMMWGDAGRLHWLIRPADLAAGRFDAASFTWQCG
ncbi:YwqG family protein [Amycolatopsis sp. NPDC006125]|uniref:YwqG family protein n=1 Tax=Amycolatopsis sp. NPDC006125 TaxID=3156730 RepID=UPI0033B54A2C